MPPDLSKSEVSEVKEEGNLLIEAVSLLVQRQRETEGWVAEQIWQAEERAAAAERRYAELEDRLSGIEEHLSRLVNELEPAPGANAQVDQRLSRLREQVEDLKTVGTDGRPAASPRLSPIAEGAQPRSREVEAVVGAPDERGPQTPGRAVRYADTPAAPELAGRAARHADTPAAPELPAESARPSDRRSAPATSVASAPRASRASTDVGFLDLLGSSGADRWGAVLIAVGAVAVLFAVLTSLRFG